MATFARALSRRSLPLAAWLDALAPVLVALAFGLLLGVGVRFQSVYEFDPDEGNNLIKALLLQRGHAFFSEIWSDQPPLYAYLCAGAFRLFGSSVTVARLVTLALTSAMVGALFDLLRRREGVVAALAPVPLLLLSQHFTRLTFSAMIGLPSIALAVVAIWALERSRGASRPLWWIGASGALLGASLMTKLFTAFLVPILGLAAVVLAARQPGERPWAVRGLRGGVIWMVALLLVTLLVLRTEIASGAALVTTHRAARAAYEAPGLAATLSADLPLFTLAAVGLARGLGEGRQDALLFGAWLAIAAAALQGHAPLWYHHALLLTVPAAALAAIALGGIQASAPDLGVLLRRHRGGVAALVRLVALVAYGGLVCWAVPKRAQEVRHPVAWTSGAADRAVERALRRAGAGAGTMLTSRQIYAFRLGMAVPPNLAVTSLKRFKVGSLKTADVTRELAAARPRFVVMTSRWPTSLRRSLRRQLKAGYARRRGVGGAEIWVRRQARTRR